MKEKIAILIPCYNEELTVEKVVSDFKKELPEASIFVYDNNSKDRTAELAKKAGAIVVREFNQGKGNVVRSMFRDVDAEAQSGSGRQLWYWFDKNGIMAKDWKQIDGQWEYFSTGGLWQYTWTGN